MNSEIENTFCIQKKDLNITGICQALSSLFANCCSKKSENQHEKRAPEHLPLIMSEMFHFEGSKVLIKQNF